MRTATIDASSPAAAQSSTATTSTGAFQPPNGSWIVCLGVADANTGALDERLTFATTATGITFVEIAFDNANGGACCGIWAAYVGGNSQSLIVDCTDNKGAVPKRFVTRVYTDCGGIGAVSTAHAGSVSYTATREQSLGLAVSIGTNVLAVAGTGQVIIDETTGFDSGDAMAVWGLTLVTQGAVLAGQSITMNVTGMVGLHIAAIELLPVDVGQPVPPIPAHLLVQLLTEVANLQGGAATASTPNTNDAGTTSLPVTARGTVVKNAAVAASCSLPLRTAGLPVHGAAKAGSSSSALRAAGLPARGAVSAGRSTSAFTTAGSDTGGGHPQTGTSALPLVARSSAVRAALPTGRANATVTTTTTVRRAALATSATSATVTATTTAKRAALPAGTTAGTIRTTGTVVRQAQPSAAGRIALRTSGTVARTVSAVGRTVLAITSVRSSAQPPAAPVPGRAVLGSTSSANTIGTTTAARATGTTSAAAATTRTTP